MTKLKLGFRLRHLRLSALAAILAASSPASVLSQTAAVDTETDAISFSWSIADAPAGDANDSGKIDIADAITVLGHLFASAGPLPSPFGQCGVDETTDVLDCRSFPPCAGA